jgi:hypothetical protein
VSVYRCLEEATAATPFLAKNTVTNTSPLDVQRADLLCKAGTVEVSQLYALISFIVFCLYLKILVRWFDSAHRHHDFPVILVSCSQQQAAIFS